MFDIDITQFRFDHGHVIYSNPINGKISAFNISVCYWTSAGTAVDIWDDDFSDFFNEVLNEKEVSLLKNEYNNEQEVYKSFLDLKESLEGRYRLKLYKNNSDGKDKISFFHLEEKL
ncbi:hypothetical protein C8D70_12512 [Chryseobacterium sp. CBTAP 102]|uniref:hypothetical protein n=1 Tax=Chryseobacterium sp. CBTAP 102 TaxID=2135644 RepID=UPI000D752AE0|nr:hypothetical protein [Chryseobacterium sp. CBTAP 102]PXW06480.1 hypothetical protein C8D70_12512 [Chryseobacterium sp. CBTAP 102]